MSGEDEQQEQTIAEDLVVTKYKMGGDIANRECGLRGPGIEAERERCRAVLGGAGAAGSCEVSYRGARTGPLGRRGGKTRCRAGDREERREGPRQARTLGLW